MLDVRRLVLVSLALLAAGSASAASGAKSIKKLPFVITKPGHYLLAQSLAVTQVSATTGSDAIQVKASHVTLDLNGFEVSTELAGQGIGITTDGTAHDIHVLNGSLRGFDDGIFLYGDGHFTCEDVQVFDSKEIGIWLDGAHSAARHCTVRHTGGGGGNQIVQGIRIQKEFAEVTDCTVAEFSRDDASFAVTGIYIVGTSAIVRGNVVSSYLNAAALTTGIQVGSDSYVAGNVVEYFAKGMELSNAVYLDNASFNCTTKFNGGQDDGGNK